LTCATARDWTDGLSKVVRRSAGEAAVCQHTQPELDSLWNLELSAVHRAVGSCGQTSLLRRLAGQQHLRLTGVGAIEHQVHRPSQSIGRTVLQMGRRKTVRTAHWYSSHSVS